METSTMNPLTQDLSIFKKFNFEKQPVGVKFLYRKPEGIKKLDKQLAICEMVVEAQGSEAPFYMTGEEEDCFGAVTLGMKPTPPFADAGMVGLELGIFKEPRANSRIYTYLPKVHPGAINYVVFASLDNLTFEPDLLIVSASISQAEILFRAVDDFASGPRESKITGVFGCAWLFTYPYQTGKINYTITGLGYGPKAKEVFPEGLILISIPYDWIPVLIHSLKQTEWELSTYKMGVKKFKEFFEVDVIGKLVKEMENSSL